MRILHFSDVHLDVSLQAVPPIQWLGKRLIGGLNLYFFRHKAFSDVAGKLDQLCAFVQDQAIDLAISTGDFTLLGTEVEFKAVSRALAPMHRARHGLIAVPGNHDQYVHEATRRRRFERYFAGAATSDRPDLLTDGCWPAVRLLGSELAVISVNSARPNPWPWRSSGRIPRAQLEGLERALRDPDIASRFVFIATHYAPRLADGGDDRWNHGLVNSAEFLDVCAPVERGAILCGHVHKCYRVRIPGVGPEIFCAGSATINKGAGCWLFTTGGGEISVSRGVYRDRNYRLL